MTAITLKNKTNKVINEYIADLDRFSLAQLQQQAPGGWALGQVYIHLWMSAKGFFFKNAERCLQKEGTVRGKGRNWIGHLVFLFGRMPAVKVKMPDSVAVEPKMPDSKEYIIGKMEEVRALSNAYTERMSVGYDPNERTRHPFLGYLNAGEWIALCNMHFRHHEAQKRRIEKTLK